MRTTVPVRMWICGARLHLSSLPREFCAICGAPMDAFVKEHQ